MSIETARSLGKLLLATAMICGGLAGAAQAQQPWPEEDEEEDAQPVPDPGVPPLLPPPPPPPPAAPEPAATAGTPAAGKLPEDKGEVIILTGSTIERRDLTTPAPLAIVDKEALDASGMVSIGDILQNLPSQSNAINVQFNNGGDGATRVALRGLDDERTLVLVNGRRHVTWNTSTSSSVDLNSIPVAVIERVEVLKDGASAIYGSDAIGGVVNIITRKQFEGTETALYTGTAAGGAVTYDVSAASGHASENGNIMLSAGFYRQNEMMAAARPYSSSDKIYDWETHTATPGGSPVVPQGYIRDRGESPGNATWQDLVADHPSGVYYNDPTTGWRDFNGRGNSDLPPDDPRRGDLYNYQPENYLVTPQQRYNIFSTGSYRLGADTSAFYETSYINRRSDQMLAPEPVVLITEGIRLSRDNLYNPFGRDFVDVRRRMVEAGNRRFFQNVDTFRIVAGLEGHLPAEFGLLEGWRWGINYNYGRAESIEVNEGRFVRSRFAAAVGPSHVDASGRPRCGTIENPGDPACIPLNLLSGQGTVSKEMLDYLTYTGTSNQFNMLESILFNSSGKLAETPWGGDIAMAIGAEYRDLAGGDEPDPLTASGDTTGNKSAPTLGGYDVKEIFGELSVVPFVGVPLAEWFEVNAAARAFDYSTFGSGATWKVGSLWRIGAGLAVRGTYSTAFRAPSINELYAGRGDAFPPVTDPCDTTQPRSVNENLNCTADGLPPDYKDDRAQILSPIGGNSNLDPETAKTFTFGTVFEPTFLPRLAVTLDYFNISVDDAIAFIGASVILANCYGQPPEQRSQEMCALITRDSTGFITSILNIRQNIGGAETSGVDFTVRYEHQTPIGRLRHRVEGTWLQKYNETTAARKVIGRGVYDLGVYPEWKFNFTSLWGRGPVSGGFNLRYIGAFTECEDNDCAEKNVSSRPVNFNITTDLFANYTFASPAGQTRVSFGVNNFLNQYPAVIYNGFLADSDASTYDYLGRYFYLRLFQQF